MVFEAHCTNRGVLDSNTFLQILKVFQTAHDFERSSITSKKLESMTLELNAKFHSLACNIQDSLELKKLMKFGQKFLKYDLNSLKWGSW